MLKNRLAIAKRTGIIAALSSAALLIAPAAAMANGGNWAAQLGNTGQGCYAYTNWTSDTVIARVYQQSNDATCNILMYQTWRSSGESTDGGTAYANTTGSGQTATAIHPGSSPDDFYYGPDGSGYLCVNVYGTNSTTGQEAEAVYGTNCPTYPIS
jgi:hypothetical protein